MTQENPTPRTSFFSALRNSFLTGIVVIAPVGLTIWMLWSFAGWVDGVVLPLLPNAYLPENILFTLFGWNIHVGIRGLGIVFFLVFTVVVGWLAKGFFGRSLIRWGETLVNRMPVVRSIYSGLKQIAETVFAQQERSFEHACLVQYPRHGIWAVGFVTTRAKGEIAQCDPDGRRVLSVFVPTTPNPTSGFLLFFPEDDVHVLDMNIEDAAKLVISAGLVYPNQGKVTGPAPEEQ